MDIQWELHELKKNQVDLLPGIREQGYPKIDPSTLSKYINGRSVTPQAQAVLAICCDIIEKWKEEKKKQENRKKGDEALEQ